MRRVIRSIHSGIVTRSRLDKSGEFDEDGKKYNALFLRMYLDDKKPYGPASVIFGALNDVIKNAAAGEKTLPYKYGAIVIAPVYGKRIYANPAYSNVFPNSLNQPYLTIAGALMLDYKFLQSPENDGNLYGYNETTITPEHIKEEDLMAVVTNPDNIPHAKESKIFKRNPGAGVSHYDVRSGKIFRNNREVHLPENVLTIENMKFNSAMFRYAEKKYEEDVKRYAHWLLDCEDRSKINEIGDEWINARDFSYGPRIRLFRFDVMEYVKTLGEEAIKNKPNLQRAVETHDLYLEEKNKKSRNDLRPVEITRLAPEKQQTK